MKNLNITFEDEEYEHLSTLKNESDDLSWRAWILELSNYQGGDSNGSKV